MTCRDVRQNLPLHLYGDLVPDERSGVDHHLEQCAECRRELAALAQVRAGLSATPVPASLDLQPAWQAELLRQRRSVRRWRLAALAALAATVLIFALRLELRVGDRQMIVRWGQPQPIAAVEPPPAAIVRESVPADLDARLQTLAELVRAFAENMEAGDRERADRLGQVRQEMAALRQENRRRWSETAREVDALYTAQFGARQSGVNP